LLATAGSAGGSRRVYPKRCAAGWDLEVFEESSRVTLSPLAGHVVHHEAPVTVIELTRDGRLCVSGDLNGRLLVSDLTLRLALGELVDHEGPIRALTIAEDERTAATGSDDGTIVIWDLSARRRIGLLRGHGAAVSAIARSSQPGMLASGGADGAILVWDVARCMAAGAGDPVRLEGHRDAVACLAFEAEGRFMASGDVRGNVLVWDVRAVECVARLAAVRSTICGPPMPTYFTQLAWSDDGLFLYGDGGPPLARGARNVSFEFSWDTEPQQHMPGSEGRPAEWSFAVMSSATRPKSDAPVRPLEVDVQNGGLSRLQRKVLSAEDSSLEVGLIPSGPAVVLPHFAAEGRSCRVSLSRRGAWAVVEPLEMWPPGSEPPESIDGTIFEGAHALHEGEVLRLGSCPIRVQSTAASGPAADASEPLGGLAKLTLAAKFVFGLALTSAKGGPGREQTEIRGRVFPAPPPGMPSEVLEIEHLLAGLCGVREALALERLRRRVALPESETMALAQCLAGACFDPDRVWVRLAGLWATEHSAPAIFDGSWSPPVLEVFRAASASGPEAIGLIPLLGQVLQRHAPLVDQVLREQAVDLEALSRFCAGSN
jgi:hypothetical protein